MTTLKSDHKINPQAEQCGGVSNEQCLWVMRCQYTTADEMDNTILFSLSIAIFETITDEPGAYVQGFGGLTTRRYRIPSIPIIWKHFKSAELPWHITILNSLSGRCFLFFLSFEPIPSKVNSLNPFVKLHCQMFAKLE